MTIKDFFSLKHNRVFWLNIIGMVVFVVAVIVGTFKWMDHYTQHGKGVEVPDVKGMLSAEAMLTLRSCGLQLDIVDSIYIASQPVGAIVEQSPGVGAIVKSGRTVYLTVNSGNVPKRTIPDIIDNCSLREAQAKMGAAGFKLTPNVYIYGETDWVYGVRYGERELHKGDKVPIGATLTLVVGDNGQINPDEEDEESTTTEEATTVDESWF